VCVQVPEERRGGTPAFVEIIRDARRARHSALLAALTQSPFSVSDEELQSVTPGVDSFRPEPLRRISSPARLQQDQFEARRAGIRQLGVTPPSPFRR
jgi:hypothetical protein